MTITGRLLAIGPQMLVGDLFSGSVTQSGGTLGLNSSSNATGNSSFPGLYIAGGPGMSGSYTMTSGLIQNLNNASIEVGGYGGQGHFLQSGGTVNLQSSVQSNLVNNIEVLGGSATLNGTAVLIGGIINASATASVSIAGSASVGGASVNNQATLSIADSALVGYANCSGGTLTQTGGTIAGGVYIDNGGIYQLRGGLISSGTMSETISGSLLQTGGMNSAALVSVASGGSYTLSGGSLQFASVGGLQVVSGGTFNGAGTSAALNIPANSILDLSGSYVNTRNMSVSVGANSLVVVPSNANPLTYPTSLFQSFSNQGTVHVARSTLSIAAGQTVSFPGSFADPVNVQGTLAAPPSSGSGLTLKGGMSISGNASVSLGDGTFAIDGNTSSMTGGVLSNNVTNVNSSCTVGGNAYGAFNHSGGTVSVESIRVGGSSYAYPIGTYNLSSNGVLNCSYLELGSIGNGYFNQSGGVNNSNSIDVGGGESPGFYTLSGGSVSATYEGIGGSIYTGNTFTQTGGTNALYSTPNPLGKSYNRQGGSLGIGDGTYNLNGGLLLLASNGISVGTGAFNFSGGTLGSVEPVYSTGAMTLTNPSSGSLNINTSGGDITLAGGLWGTGGILKTGAGKLVLSANFGNAYSGGTVVSAGTLAVQNQYGTATGYGPVTIAAGATLSVNGAIGAIGAIAGKVTVASGGAINLFDGAYWTTAALVNGGSTALIFSDANAGDTALQTGANVSLNFGVGKAASQLVVQTAKVAFGGSTPVTITPVVGFGGGTYQLINFASGQASGLDNLTLTASKIDLLPVSLLKTDTAEELIVGTSGTASSSSSVSSTGGSAQVSVQADPSTTSGAIQATFSNVSAGTLTNNYYLGSSISDVANSIGSTAASQIDFKLAGDTVQLWDLSYSGEFSGSTDVTFSYEPTLLNEGDLLQIEHFVNGKWEVPTQTVDQVNHTITVDVNSFSPFALESVPEPSTIALIAVGAVGLVGWVWRCRRT